MEYIGVYNSYRCEKVIDKSRFITDVARTESESEAKAFIAAVRDSHPLATHVCYGYIADRLGNLQRFSDDGEPQGTAGMPILEAVKAKRLLCTAVTVTRYFGGIKLGAGGLVRAYSSCAADGLNGAEKRLFAECKLFEVTVAYDRVGAVKGYIETAGFSLSDTVYGEQVAFTVAVRETESERFNREMTDLTAGKAKISEKKGNFYPFPLEI